MKKMMYLCLTITGLLFLRCAPDEEIVSALQKVQFAVTLNDQHSPNGKTTAELPDGSVLRISIENNSGPVVADQEIELLKIGDGYISSPLELMPDHYEIVDFMIVHGSQVLFAAPKHGSPLSGLVSTPLPAAFVVNQSSTANIEMQVVSTSTHAPEDFGYASFGVELIQPLQLSVFGMEEASANLITSQVKIWQGDVLVLSDTLPAQTNTINFPGNPNMPCSIEIYAEGGYELHTSTFTYNTLVDELDGSPYKVMLHPALDLGIYMYSYSPDTPLELFLGGEGEVIINGPAEFAGTHSLPMYFQEIALEEGMYHVTIKGDIDQITEIRSFSYNGGIETIDGVHRLPALQVFDPGINFDDALDLSHNTALTFLSLVWVSLPEWFVLPEDHHIQTFSLESYDNQELHIITEEEFDIIVDNIHRNAVEKGISNGSFWANEVAEISESAHQKLIELRDWYGWAIEMEGYW